LQQSFFSELVYNNHREKKMQWVAGMNWLADDFNEDKQGNDPVRDYHYNTYGLFVQNTWSPNDLFTLETYTGRLCFTIRISATAESFSFIQDDTQIYYEDWCGMAIKHRPYLMKRLKDTVSKYTSC